MNPNFLLRQLAHHPLLNSHIPNQVEQSLKMEVEGLKTSIGKIPLRADKTDHFTPKVYREAAIAHIAQHAPYPGAWAGLDAEGVNFARYNLRGDLSGVNLKNAELSHIKGSRLNLENANLAGAKMEEADLRNANLKNADLTEAVLSSSDLSNANLQHAHLSDATLYDTNLTGTDLSHANLTGADLLNARVDKNTNLSYASMPHANASSETSVWEGSVPLQDWAANMTGTNAQGATFFNRHFNPVLNGTQLHGIGLGVAEGRYSTGLEQEYGGWHVDEKLSLLPEERPSITVNLAGSAGSPHIQNGRLTNSTFLNSHPPQLTDTTVMSDNVMIQPDGRRLPLQPSDLHPDSRNNEFVN